MAEPHLRRHGIPGCIFTQHALQHKRPTHDGGRSRGQATELLVATGPSRRTATGRTGLAAMAAADDGEAAKEELSHVFERGERLEKGEQEGAG